MMNDERGILRVSGAVVYNRGRTLAHSLMSLLNDSAGFAPIAKISTMDGTDATQDMPILTSDP